MVVFLTIIQYFIQGVVDIFDKTLISKEKIHPVNYTFFTVVTGAALLIIWPWVYAPLPAMSIWLNLLSGAFFSAAMYVFFKALEQGEVARVVTYVFALIPVFDVVISIATGRSMPTMAELSALCLLIPGAFLISYRQGIMGTHIVTKTLAAFMLSVYEALWQYGSRIGDTLPNLMWNRLGAALILVLLLVFPLYRRRVFDVRHVTNRKKTGFLFLFKQALGGFNFIFQSHLYRIGTIAVVSALQGFRFLFLFCASFVLNKKYQHLLKEEQGQKYLGQKLFAIGLIMLGTLILFLN